jgi:hypothetical protein
VSLIEAARVVVKEASETAGRVSYSAVVALAKAIRDEDNRKQVEIRTQADQESAQ